MLMSCTCMTLRIAFAQSCQSEMDRVLHQVRVKEQHLLRAADQSSSSRARCGQLAQQVDQLLREREEMNEEFARLHEEVRVRKYW